LYLNQEAHLSIKAKILRSKNQETIASFLEMDEESFYHLKRLMQFNAANPDQIEKELDKSAFIRFSSEQNLLPDMAQYKNEECK
jgi:hypothetical protein